MEKHVLIINGSGGVGKDTFVDMLNKYMRVTRCSAVDTIKECAVLLGWNGEKNEKTRKFLSDLKKLAVDCFDEPFKHMSIAVENFRESRKNNILCLFIREPEEIERAKDAFGAITVLVTNKNIEPILSNESDANVAKFEYDVTIENDGTLEDLEDKAYLFLKQLYPRVFI